MENNTENNQRREFLKKSLSLSGIILCAGSISALLDSCSSPVNASPGGTGSFDVTTVPQLSVDGGVVEKTFSGQFGNAAVIIIRETGTSYVAFSTICPHQGNIVNYPKNSTSDIVCPVHGSHFSPVDGSRISGPAPNGLTKYTTSFDAATKILTITG